MSETFKTIDYSLILGIVKVYKQYDLKTLSMVQFEGEK